MFKLWATILKDIRILQRDKTGITLMFVMPIMLVIVVTNIQNSTFQLVSKNKLPILVCNNDTGQAGKQLIATVNKIGMFKVLQIAGNQNSKQMSVAMHGEDAMLGMVIPANFSAKVEAKSKNTAGKALKSFGLDADTLKQAVDIDPLTLYYSPVLQEPLRLSVEGAVRSSLQLVESRETLRSLYFSINEKPLPETLENEMLNNKTAINEIPVSREGARINPNATQHNVPAWTIFAMFFVIMSLGGSVVREKVSGSFIRLKTLPTNYVVAILSKQITYLGVTILQAVVIFSIGIWIFPLMDLPGLSLPADIPALLVLIVLTGWCAVSYAICVGVFSETQEQVNGFGAISIVILSAIGGLMVPSFAMQGFFKSATNFSPMHWSLQAFYTLFLEGGKLKDIFNNAVLLFIITILLQFLTFLGLKRKNLI
jgi:ABC-2 type transport system permease protein